MARGSVLSLLFMLIISSVATESASSFSSMLMISLSPRVLFCQRFCLSVVFDVIKLCSSTKTLGGEDLVHGIGFAILSFLTSSMLSIVGRNHIDNVDIICVV